MSTVISGGYPMAEKLHKDFQSNSFFGRDVGDISFSLTSMQPGTNEKFPPRSNASLVGVWPMQRPANLIRRNSTSSVSSISSTRNRLNMNSLTSMANVIPETTTATITAANISSMPTMEERFRGRAFSEGASSLSMESNLPPQQPQQQPGALSRYKTELCRPFEENGKCKYGDKCQFAHGKQELRHLIRHPKYKTELCRTFHTSGFCPYGPRCHFIHNQDDSANRANIALQAAANHQQPQGAPMAVPTPHISERNHLGRRPAHLSLLTKQLSTGTAVGNLPFQSTQTTLGGSPPYYKQDLGSSALMSPTSPSSVNNGTMFNFSDPATALASYMMNAQYDSTFEMLLSQGPQYETTVNDDSAFEGSMTPPDSDPESMTGSPPEKQRLPIFRCLSQTS